MEFSPSCGLEAHPSNRRRTARPVEGRDVVQRTGPTQVDSDARPVEEALLDALEDDLRTPQRRIRRTRRRVCSDSEGRHQSGGLASSADATTVAASSTAVRAAHVDICQSVHRICIDTDSSTEEIRMPARVPGRLVLTSRSVPVTQVRAPDSHDERLDRVRNEVRRDRRTRIQQTATNFLLGLASRVGPSSGADDIPREIRRQQWSVFNVPLMWSAAAGDEGCPMLEWIVHRAEQCPRINICGEEMGCGEAIRGGMGSPPPHVRISGHSFTRKFGRMDSFRRFSPTKMGCTFQWSSSGEDSEYGHCAGCEGSRIRVSARAGCGSRVPTSGQVAGQPSPWHKTF